MNWRVIKRIAGVILVIVGLFSIFTPLTPGGWLLLVGAELLGIELISPHKLREMSGRLWARLRGRRIADEV